MVALGYLEDVMEEVISQNLWTMTTGEKLVEIHRESQS